MVHNLANAETLNYSPYVVVNPPSRQGIFVATSLCKFAMVMSHNVNKYLFSGSIKWPL